MGLDVTYKGSQIAQLTEDGNLTLETAGKYCEGNIGLAYTGDIVPVGTKQVSIVQNGTITEDVTNYANVEISASVPFANTARIDFSSYQSINECHDFISAYIVNLITDPVACWMCTFYNNTNKNRAAIKCSGTKSIKQGGEVSWSGATSRVGNLNNTNFAYGFDVYAGAYCIVEWSGGMPYV